MPPVGTFTRTFTVPGNYVYVRIPHEKDNMIGEIAVTK
jgi:plastocyanin